MLPAFVREGFLFRERQIVARICRAFKSQAVTRGLLAGPGKDDAAVLRQRAVWVASCDHFLENTHFLPDLHPPHVVGYKALARAASDIAAMGAAPRFFLLALALPPRRTGKWLDAFLNGMASAARRLGLTLIGGDTSRGQRLAIVVTVLGEARGPVIQRKGARAGHFLFVSGKLGAAQLGLELVQRGWWRVPRWKNLLRRHLSPEPRIELGLRLARLGVSAMIDTSDGLSTDLSHLCEASGVGARIFWDQLPRVRVPGALAKRGIDPQRLALDGGEDYELLFTVSPRQARKLPPALCGVPLTRIGLITRGRNVEWVDWRGKIRRLQPGGWDSFAPSRRRP